MINQENIVIDNSVDGTVIERVSPFTMVLSTSAFSPTNKVWKIVYDFGNGATEEKVLGLSTTPNLDVPISDEPGDPRNFIVSSKYFFDDVYMKDYTVTINFYEIGVSSPETVKFTLRLRLMKIAELFSTFDSIKLVGSRMFGLDNQVLYLFESQNPNYLIPVLAKF